MSAPRGAPTVAVRARGATLRFGECIHDGFTQHPYTSSEVQSEHTVPTRVRLDLQWTSPHDAMLRLLEADGRGPSVPFEHACPCPARVHTREGLLPAKDKNIRIGVAVVVESEARGVLLTQRAASLSSFPNGWVVPGGHVEPGESLAQAGAREVLEETGLAVNPARFRLLGVWESTWPFAPSKTDPITHQHVVCYFHVRLETELALRVQPSEIGAVSWISPEDAGFLSSNVEAGGKPEHRKLRVVAVEGDAAGARDWARRVLVAPDGPAEDVDARVLQSNLTLGTRFALRTWLQRVKGSGEKSALL